jgi:hypothetical protein
MHTQPARPRRFSARNYEAASANASCTEHRSSEACVDASWDAGLMLVMQSWGIAIAEEAVATRLLEDLRTAARLPCAGQGGNKV